MSLEGESEQTNPEAPVVAKQKARDPEVEAAARVFQMLLKGIKNIGIYRHAENRYPEYLEPAHRLLTQFLEEHESLPLRLEPFSLKYRGQPIYEDEDRENLTYKFYRDGVRYLIFRRGIPVEELLNFVLLAMERFNERLLFQEDMVTRLWKQDLRYIEHIVVEGFGFGDMSEEEVEIEVEKIIGFLKQQLAAHGDDVARFARLSVEDLELRLDDVEQIRGGVVSGRTATPQDRSRTQDELIYEQKKRTFAKMVLILFQILELEARTEDYEMLNEAFTQVLDSLLVSEDIRGAVALLLRFGAIRQRQLAPERAEMVESLEESIRARMLEPQRLQSVANYLTLSRELDVDAVQTYLEACGEAEIPHLLDMLVSIERPDARKILIEVLARVGKDKVGTFAAELANNSSNVVRDMLEIIHLISPPGKLGYIAKTLEHPNLVIRLEGLKQFAKSKEPESLRYLEKAAQDSDIQMRIGAYRALAQRNPKRAADFFVRLMRAESFSARDHREKLTVATALGETRQDTALQFFDQVFSQKSNLFQRSKLQEMKNLAIVGLAAFKDVRAFKILAREVQNRSNGKEVMQAAHKAALRLREELESGRKEARE